MSPLTRSLRWPVVLAGAIVVIDQLTKHWAINALSDGHRVHVLGSLQFRLAFNTGVAFSTGSDLGPFVGVISLVAMCGLLVIIGRSRMIAGGLPIAAVIGGAIGNLIDRVFRGDAWLRGGVVDFIDLQWWPIFNVADMAIVLGGIAIVLGGLLSMDDAEPAPAAAGDDPAAVNAPATDAGPEPGPDGATGPGSDGAAGETAGPDSSVSRAG